MIRTVSATDRTPRVSASPPAPVHTVAPDVRELALKLAAGDRRRLVVIGDDEVLIRNRPS